MAKKKKGGKFDFSTGEASADNPFAALAGLGNDLPPPPDDLPEDTDAGASAGAVPAEEQRKMALRVHLDRKHRRGKEATIVTGHTGTDEQVEALAGRLKKQCGVGGAAKDGEIIIQGNKRDKVVELLRKEGYTDVKKAGG